MPRIFIRMGLINFAGLCWAAAFLGFAIAYWDALTRPRLKH